LNAALRPCFAGFNRVNHCGVPISTPHSSGFARLASEAFYFAIPTLSFYNAINLYGLRNRMANTLTDKRHDPGRKKLC